MKKNILAIAVFAIAVLFSNDLSAQKFSTLDKSPMDAASFPTDYKISDKIVKVVYSRPQLKGRALESLAPSGKVWRMGANESTEVTFYKDVTFGGKSVKAGSYTMFAIPGKSEWTIMLSKSLHTWGSGSYKDSNDVVRVTAKVSKADKVIEAFSIAYSKTGDVYFGWGNTVVTTSVK